MQNFNVKLLGFYIVAIGFVVFLFKTVTTYGETALKAPANIAGRYRFPADRLPGCLKSEALLLTLQQSGIYINASLWSTKDEKQSAISTTEERPSLSGKFQNQKIRLSGSVPHILACQRASGKAGGVYSPSIQIEGAIVEETFTGTIRVSPDTKPTKFTAHREEIIQQPKSEH